MASPEYDASQACMSRVHWAVKTIVILGYAVAAFEGIVNQGALQTDTLDFHLRHMVFTHGAVMLWLSVFHVFFLPHAKSPGSAANAKDDSKKVA
jgi:hypothetical protein